MRGDPLLSSVAPPPSQVPPFRNTHSSQTSHISSISGDSHRNFHHPPRSGGRNQKSASHFIVLHGRVLRRAPSSSSEHAFEPMEEGGRGLGRIVDRSPGELPTPSGKHESSRKFKEQPGTVRESMQRKSKYYELRQDVQNYRKQVESLGQLLRQFIADTQTSNGSHRYYKPEPEPSQTDAWRLRILVKSAVDTDKTLWGKLYEYERSLQDKDEQNSCVRLHRDFKRIHNGLVMCLSLIDEHRSNHPVLRQLGGVGWARVISQPDAHLEEEIEQRMPQMPKFVEGFEFQDQAASSQRATFMEFEKEEIEPQPIEPMGIDPSDDYEPVESGLMEYDADEGEESLLDTKYEESLTDTKTTLTRDFVSIDDRTFEDESESSFECLYPGFSCFYFNRDKDKNDVCLPERSNWDTTMRMIRQDIRTVQRGIVRHVHGLTGTRKQNQ